MGTADQKTDLTQRRKEEETKGLIPPSSSTGRNCAGDGRELCGLSHSLDSVHLCAFASLREFKLFRVFR
jgi:hypothetical protein